LGHTNPNTGLFQALKLPEITVFKRKFQSLKSSSIKEVAWRLKLKVTYPPVNFFQAAGYSEKMI
jgi:hypothetical protein